MELEFDKEIDAILRKARPDRGVLVGDDPPEPKEPREQKNHVDADAIAAFAENALPEKARLLYMEHFADCDRCRKSLSFLMQMNAKVDASQKNAAPVVLEAASERTIPWYQSIFRTPNIAFTMGALVLAFSGVLGYLVLQKQNDASKATISQVTEVPDHDEPEFRRKEADAIPTPSDAPVMASNSASSSANTAANTATAFRGDDTNSVAKTAPAANVPGTRSGQFQIDGASGSENNYILDGQEVGDTKTAKKPAAAAPLVTTDSTVSGAVAERDEKKASTDALKKQPKDVDLAKRKLEAGALRNDASPPPAKTAGPLQNQSNQSNGSQMSVTRTVGGKTFANRNGAWYDSAYKNQTTSNYRRGTNEYKKLDSGLRSIADTLGGTVVVVWKAKVYRIQ